MNIGTVITKARDMYIIDGVFIFEPSGVDEFDGGYLVEAFLWVPKDEETEAPPARDMNVVV
ncbi:MAG: hypothetical protein HY936_07000 [Nitrosomonadales bacterium]|nr:hypothetical protein [Nitrosomonadales bacterium]